MNMNELKFQALRDIIESFTPYNVSQAFKIEYNDLVLEKENYSSHYSEMDITKILKEEELIKLLNHKNLVDNIFNVIFPLNDPEEYNLPHKSYVVGFKKTYEKLIILFGKEESINSIFKYCSNITNGDTKHVKKYSDFFILFLKHVVYKSENKKNIESMFLDFKSLAKNDKINFYPLLEEFVKKGISADDVFQSIKDLNNGYLEGKLVSYLNENQIDFSFEIKKNEMFKIEENIIFEKKIILNLNYFMNLGFDQEQTTQKINKFADLILKTEDIFYLTKQKDKNLILTIKSVNEEKVNNVVQKIKFNSHLITEFIKADINIEGYNSKFKLYWDMSITNQNNKVLSKRKI